MSDLKVGDRGFGASGHFYEVVRVCGTHALQRTYECERVDPEGGLSDSAAPELYYLPILTKLAPMKVGDQGYGVDGRLFEVTKFLDMSFECQEVNPKTGRGSGALYSLCYLDLKDASSPVPVDPRVALKKRLAELIAERSRLSGRVREIDSEWRGINSELAKLGAG